MIGPDDVIGAHELCSHHRNAIKFAGEASCFFCGKHVRYAQIREWIDGDKTGTCPHCMVDALLPGKIDDAFLKKMYDHWFAVTHEMDKEER